METATSTSTEETNTEAAPNLKGTRESQKPPKYSGQYPGEQPQGLAISGKIAAGVQPGGKAKTTAHATAKQ